MSPLFFCSCMCHSHGKVQHYKIPCCCVHRVIGECEACEEKERRKRNGTD